MTTQPTHENIGNPEARMSAHEVLSATTDVRRHLGITAKPYSEPNLFHAQSREANPRYTGERHDVRYALEADETVWSKETKQSIMAAAEDLRMLKHETPLVGHHDIVIVPAGARQATLDRLRHVAEAVDEGRATVGQIFVGGSARKLKDAEQQNVRGYAPEAEIEFDLALGATGVIQKEFAELGLLITPVFVNKERASTPDIFEASFQALEKTGRLTKKLSVAAVTHQIYETSTSLDLARVAKTHGIKNTFVAGRTSDPATVEKRTPATYVTEIIRTDRAAVNFVQAEKAEKTERAARLGSSATRAARPVQSEEIGSYGDDGSKIVSYTDGSRWVHKPRGGTWRLYKDGLVYDNPDDVNGRKPTPQEAKILGVNL